MFLFLALLLYSMGWSLDSRWPLRLHLTMLVNTELEFQNAINNDHDLSKELEIWLTKAHGAATTRAWRESYAADARLSGDTGHLQARLRTDKRRVQLLDAAAYWRMSGDVWNQKPANDDCPHRQSGQWPKSQEDFLNNLEPEYITLAMVPQHLTPSVSQAAKVRPLPSLVSRYWKHRLISDDLRMVEIARAERRQSTLDNTISLPTPRTICKGSTMQRYARSL